MPTPIAVSTSKHSPLLPDVATIAEAGVPNFDYAIWYGVWARADTPQLVVDKMAKNIARTLSASDLHDWLVKHGANPMSMSQAEFACFVVNESESAAHILNAAEVRRQEAQPLARKLLR